MNSLFSPGKFTRYGTQTCKKKMLYFFSISTLKEMNPNPWGLYHMEKIQEHITGWLEGEAEPS